MQVLNKIYNHLSLSSFGRQGQKGSNVFVMTLSPVYFKLLSKLYKLFNNVINQFPLSKHCSKTWGGDRKIRRLHDSMDTLTNPETLAR